VESVAGSTSVAELAADLQSRSLLLYDSFVSARGVSNTVSCPPEMCPTLIVSARGVSNTPEVCPTRCRVHGASRGVAAPLAPSLRLLRVRPRCAQHSFVSARCMSNTARGMSNTPSCSLRRTHGGRNRVLDTLGVDTIPCLKHLARPRSSRRSCSAARSSSTTPSCPPEVRIRQLWSGTEPRLSSLVRPNLTET